VGKLAIFAAIVSWLWEIPSRHQQAYDSAWTLINSATGKKGDGGRSSALQVLADGQMPLASVDLSYAVIRNVKLKSADLFKAKFIETELDHVSFECRWTFTKQPCSNLEYTVFRGANLLTVNFDGANLSGASFINTLNMEVKMNGTRMVSTLFVNTVINSIELKNAELSLVTFENVSFGSFSEKQFEGATLDRVKFHDGEIKTSMFSLIKGACDVELPNGEKFDFHCIGRTDSKISSEIIKPRD
jgi:uncharacterized protein YjbI with pentapeptide repeats